MVPSAFIFLKTFPLSPNGKVDRDALQRLAPSTTDDTPTEAPATPTEMMLAEIWHEVFKRSHIGRHENFFDLGGDSLNAAVIAALVFERRGIELDLRMFLEFPTLADFAARIDSSAAGANRPVPRLSRVSRSAPLLLSFQQEHILFHARRNREVADNYTMASCDRILGPLQPALLRECMNFLVRRHEMLRTSFGEINGRPVQTVRDPEPASLAEIDLSGSPEPEQHARNLLREMAREPFDLERGPLMRFKLARLREHEHWLLSTTHHIIVDAWSRQIYFRELAILYEAKLRGEPPPLPENEPLQYADYCAWQRAQIQKDSPGFRESIAWWKDYSSRKPAPARSPFAWRHWWRRLLSGSPSARHLPLRHLRKQPAASLSEGWIWWGVEPETSRRLEQLARQEQATFYMTRLTAFAAMLAAEAGGPEVALVSYLSQRNRAELLGMFGHFVNDVALRLRCDLNHSFRQCLAETRRVVAAVQAHGEIPFEMLQDEVRAAGVEPVRIGIYFNVLDLTATRVFGGLKLTLHEQLKETMPLDFMLTFDESNEAQRCYVQFDARIYHPKRVRAFAKRLAELLDSVAQHPDTPLAGLLSGQR
jgi:acyl carrier protein